MYVGNQQSGISTNIKYIVRLCNSIFIYCCIYYYLSVLGIQNSVIIPSKYFIKSLSVWYFLLIWQYICIYLYFQSRAALSLLGYCYYFTQDFVNAANCYEHLTVVCPEVDDYKVYYAQSLYQACFYQEAMKVTCQIENPEYQTKVFIMTLTLSYNVGANFNFYTIKYIGYELNFQDWLINDN